MNAKYVVLIVCVVVGGGWFSLARFSSAAAAKGEAPAAISQSSAEAADNLRLERERLGSEMVNLRAEVAEYGQRMRAGTTAAEARSTPSAANPAPTLNREQQNARDEEVRRAHLDEIDAAFQVQPIDRVWAASMESRLRTALAAENVGLRARQVECRSSLCRLELEDDGTQAPAALEHLASSLDQALPRLTFDRTDDGRGHKTVIVYAASAAPETQPAAPKG